MKFSHAVSSGFVSCTALALLLAAGSVYSQKTPQEPITHDFDTLDANNDGVISKREADDNNVWYHFPAIDADRDQTLSREEFTNYIVQEEPLLGEALPLEKLPQPYLRERVKDDADVVTNPALMPKIETEFSELDNDGDGFISRAEADDDDMYEHFTRMDINNDSLVSDYEFESYLREYGTIVATEEVLDEALYRN
ncbi:EF-hand domain-containing protein [Proteobacteria bacterium 005FR1]|nr:EF-hand domain-containing protein [Proteobacteria bacterium 005FR1]